MKICFIAPTAYQLFNPNIKSSFGGAEVQLYFLAKEFARNKNLDVNFIVADYGQDVSEEYDGVKIFKSLDFKKNIFSRIVSFFSVFKNIDAEIYIQRALNIFSGFIGFYCKLKKKKFIYMVAHDNETDRTHSVYNNFLTSLLAGLTFKFAAHVVAQNDYQREKLRSRNIDSIVIKSSWPIEDLNIIKKDYILWVGRLDKYYKGADVFIKLAKDLPDRSFIMIGPGALGQNDYFKEIKDSAAKLNNLRFLDFVKFNEISKYYREAKMFVNTSAQEGFPNTVIQAAINKTPIISLSINPNDFITKYNCGFVCNNSYEVMKSKVASLFEDDKLYKKLSENAYKYVKENHDVKFNASKLLKLVV